MKPSEIQDLYQRLGVDRQATHDQIKSAYRLMAFQWHPDRRPYNPDITYLEFIAVSEAFEVLYDPVKRLRYDQSNHVDSFRTHQERPFKRDDYNIIIKYYHSIFNNEFSYIFKKEKDLKSIIDYKYYNKIIK